MTLFLSTGPEEAPSLYIFVDNLPLRGVEEKAFFE